MPAPSPRRWPVSSRSARERAEGCPSASVAFQNQRSSSSVEHAVAAAFPSPAAFTPAVGARSRTSRSTHQLKNLRAWASTRLAVVGVPRSTISSRRSSTSRLVIVCTSRSPQAFTTKRSRNWRACRPLLSCDRCRLSNCSTSVVTLVPLGLPRPRLGLGLDLRGARVGAELDRLRRPACLLRRLRGTGQGNGRASSSAASRRSGSGRPRTRAARLHHEVEPGHRRVRHLEPLRGSGFVPRPISPSEPSPSDHLSAVNCRLG